MKQIGKGRIYWLLAFFCLLGLSAKQVQAQSISLGIVAHPESVWVELGKTATLSVLVKGPVKSLQWRRNGEPIPDARQTTLQVTVNETKLIPDEYDVVLSDAFGQSVTSRKARVTGLPPEADQLRNESRRIESIKLQNLFNLVHVFNLLSERIAAPLRYPAPAVNPAKFYFNECPDKARVELMKPVQTSSTSHQALKLELEDCYITKTDEIGDEAGLLINGMLIQSLKTDQGEKLETRTAEKFAKNLLVRFPHAKSNRPDTPVDFDVYLDGKLIHTHETRYSAGKAARLREEYSWTNGTTIENPQSGVKAVFVSGRFVKESFGEFQGRDFYPSRESEIFDRLRLRIGKDDVLIHGGITRLTSDTTLQRFGQISISVNGKEMLVTRSTIHPPAEFKGQLPFPPKLNGFFINDHSVKNPPNRKTEGGKTQVGELRTAG